MMSQEQLMQMIMMMNPEMGQILQIMNANNQEETIPSNKPRRRTAYQRRYKAAFKKLSSRYKLKSGKWKKGGFRAAVKAAHAQARKGGKK